MITRISRALAPVVAAVAMTAVASAVPSTAVGQQATAAPDAPNVVFILADDMRADELMYMPQTKALLGDQGMTFTNAISPHPLCCPARAELLSGQYAQNNGVQHNTGPDGGYQAFDPSETIAVWAQRAGYTTSFHGKHLNGYLERDGRDPGWTHWDPLTKGVYDYINFSFFNGDKFSDDYVTTRLASRAIDDIDGLATDGKPFYLQVNDLAPHTRIVAGTKTDQVPPPPEPKYKNADPGPVPAFFSSPSFNEQDMSDKAPDIRDREKMDPAHMLEMHNARVLALKTLDDSVASIVQGLAADGELDNTYVVFTSDNAYALGEHRGYKKNLLSREVLDIPMLVRGPGIAPGSTSNRIATLVDLSATFVDITNSTPPVNIDGQSLLPTLLGQQSATRDTTLIQTGTVTKGYVPYKDWEYRGVETSRYLYARNLNSKNNEFLYDRLGDPYELQNVVRDPDYKKVRAELLHRTMALIDCSGSNCNRTFGPVPEPVHLVQPHEPGFTLAQIGGPLRR